MELLYWTGARMSDAVRISEGMVGRDGWLTFNQQKTGGEVSIPVMTPAPKFADPTDQALLIDALNARPQRHVVIMVTEHGKPRSIKGASTWFSEAASTAGLVGKTAHGLRKARASSLAENGATTHQIGAWTGHESLAEIDHYSRKAERRRILMGTSDERDSSNFLKISSNSKNKT
ncbi:Tyrosine recombinase [Ketogulonicigenium robustum]|uniref:Tyrosine recombinase n=1 Tax=Ketogulonicigenium robustum TaxID=92947 RepID=A0A1W6NZ17_9RHOB|nr:Tyrosine recombinase [Ketogulonicigenium robustum]